MASLTPEPVAWRFKTKYSRIDGWRVTLDKGEAKYLSGLPEVEVVQPLYARAERSLVDRPSPNALGNEAQAVAGSGAAASATTEPVAWLIKAHKPGKWSEWATVDPDDSVWWPMDQGWTEVTCTPLIECGPAQNILPARYAVPDLSAAAVAPEAPEPNGAESNLRGVLGSILYIAQDDKRGWNDWGRVAEICRAALAAVPQQHSEPHDPKESA